MIDERDLERASELQQIEVDASIARHRARVTVGVGSETCDCGEPISPLRREHHAATRCVDCQTRDERRGELWK